MFVFIYSVAGACECIYVAAYPQSTPIDRVVTGHTDALKKSPVPQTLSIIKAVSVIAVNRGGANNIHFPPPKHFLRAIILYPGQARSQMEILRIDANVPFRFMYLSPFLTLTASN